jgi:hypothetical protein
MKITTRNETKRRIYKMHILPWYIAYHGDTALTDATQYFLAMHSRRNTTHVFGRLAAGVGGFLKGRVRFINGRVGQGYVVDNIIQYAEHSASLLHGLDDGGDEHGTVFGGGCIV